MEEQNYYFTFGVDDELYKHKYVKIKGTAFSSREKMFKAFGANWAFQYSEDRFNGQFERWNLSELILNEDYFGNVLKNGDLILYTVRTGSYHWYNLGYITDIKNNKVISLQNYSCNIRKVTLYNGFNKTIKIPYAYISSFKDNEDILEYKEKIQKFIDKYNEFKNSINGGK